MGLTAPLFYEAFRCCVEQRHESSSDCTDKAIRSQRATVFDEQARALNIPFTPVRAFMVKIYGQVVELS